MRIEKGTFEYVAVESFKSMRRMNIMLTVKYGADCVGKILVVACTCKFCTSSLLQCVAKDLNTFLLQTDFRVTQLLVSS